MPDTFCTKPSTPFNIHDYVATFFLPDGMLDYFDIVWAEEKSITRKHDERFLHVPSTRLRRTSTNGPRSRRNE